MSCQLTSCDDGRNSMWDADGLLEELDVAHPKAALGRLGSVQA